MSPPDQAGSAHRAEAPGANLLSLYLKVLGMEWEAREPGALLQKPTLKTSGATASWFYHQHN